MDRRRAAIHPRSHHGPAPGAICRRAVTPKGGGHIQSHRNVATGAQRTAARPGRHRCLNLAAGPALRALAHAATPTRTTVSRASVRN